MDVKVAEGFEAARRTDRVAKAATDAIEAVARGEDDGNTKFLLLVLDVPSDSATLIQGNYEDPAEAAEDARIMAKAIDRGAAQSRIVWLCPGCFRPSESGPKVPDEENRPCDCGHPLMPYLGVPELDLRPSDDPAEASL